MRFKHTGERLRQLQQESKPKLRELLTAQVEEERGRPANAAEMRAVEKAVNEISDLPMYGG
ncbi:hypothetical protein [Actinomadura geliboluensis]|uniref:hypothetical protein n=1 Tax=Actinomadura geliboluensis TaxID=882440 RepID=UPI0036C705A6